MKNEKPDNLSADSVIGHYRIAGKIGAGGMGEVYLAQDMRLERKVAVKFLNEEFSRDEDKLNRFIQEAKAASALNHPNILTVYEVGEIDGRNYIAAEYIDGRTLREPLSAQETLSLNRILKIALQTAEALAAAHTNGIIHRDIKPENIMVREDGYVKVPDFGLAKLTEKQNQDEVSLEEKTKAFVQTEPGTVMGTVSYMSPEQAAGRATDARTDIWSLGVVLYEMLAGKLPFTGKTISHAIVSIFEDEPEPLENVPGELPRIIDKALSKEVETRYQTARDLLLDLKNLRRNPDMQGELDRSFVPNRETGGAAFEEHETRIYGQKTVEGAKAEALRAPNLAPYTKALLARPLAKSGERGEALKLVEELKAESATRYVPNYCLAIAAVALGEKEEASALLEKDMAAHSSFVSYLAVAPAFDDLRAEPRFKEMPKRLNLPE